MKIKYTSIYKIFIYIIFFLNLNFTNLIHKSEEIDMELAIILTIIVFIIYAFQPNKHKIYNTRLILYFSLIYIFLIYQFIESQRIGSIDFGLSMYQFGCTILLLLSFPIYEILNDDRKVFFKNIVRLGYLALFVKTIVWLMYNFFRINVAPGMWGYKIQWSRSILNFNFTRLIGTFLDIFLLIYAIVNLLKKDNTIIKKSLYFIEILFLFFYTIMISQYRAELVYYVLVTLALISIYTYKNQRKNRAVNVTLLILSVLLILFISRHYIYEFFGTFSVNNQITGSSTSYRLVEFDHFSNMWESGNKLLGFGLIPDTTVYYNAEYYLSDLGFVSTLYELGILGFTFLLLPLINGFLFMINVFKENLNSKDLVFIGLSIYLIFSLISANPYNPSRITLLPIYMGLLLDVDNERRKYEKKVFRD